MGCPSIYYKSALQCFAYTLVYMEDKKLAKELSEEESEEKLEAYFYENLGTVDKKEWLEIIYQPAHKFMIYVELDGEDSDGYKTVDFFKINYCPMCGRKLV